MSIGLSSPSEVNLKVVAPEGVSVPMEFTCPRCGQEVEVIADLRSLLSGVDVNLDCPGPDCGKNVYMSAYYSLEFNGGYKDSLDVPFRHNKKEVSAAS